MVETFKNGIKSATFVKGSKEKIVVSQDTTTTWLFSISGFGKGKAIFTHIKEGKSMSIKVSYADMVYKEIPKQVLSYIGNWIILVDDEEYYLEVVSESFAVADVIDIARIKAGKVKELKLEDEVKATIARLSRENEAIKNHLRTLEYEIKILKNSIREKF